MNCSVVIPVYRSSETLPTLISRLGPVLASFTGKHEVILVNDGSPDQTWLTITGLAAKYPFVRGINLMRNYGQHNATLCGILLAKYEIIITMDDDLQHPPEEIPSLIAKLQEGFDLVYGIPRQRPHSWWRNLTSGLFRRILSYVMGVKSMRGIGAFRAFKTDLRKAFQGFNKPEVIIDVLLSWGTHNIGYASIDENPRTSGNSNYTLSKLMRYALIVFTGFSTAPLRFASFLGFFFMLFGVVSFIYVMVVYFTVGSLMGFTFLASTISLFSGAQLFAMGIFGEYLARIFERTSERPCFTIGNTTDEDVE
jgi:glycosyltransferase involved in cell wall biosynthesis